MGLNMKWDKFKYGLFVDSKLSSMCFGLALASPLFFLADLMVDYSQVSEVFFHHILRGAAISCLIILCFYLPFLKKFGNVTLRHIKDYYESESHDKDAYMWLWKNYVLVLLAAIFVMVL